MRCSLDCADEMVRVNLRSLLPKKISSFHSLYAVLLSSSAAACKGKCSVFEFAAKNDVSSTAH